MKDYQYYNIIGMLFLIWGNVTKGGDALGVGLTLFGLLFMFWSLIFLLKESR